MTSIPGLHRPIGHRRALGTRRRSGGALVAAGALAAVASIGGFTASRANAATALTSYTLSAGARGFQSYEADPVTGARNGEGEVPETQAQLDGPIGYGLASLAWPGPLASNAGTLALVLQPTLPPESTAANYPVRAEARSGQNPPTTEYNSVPGTKLTSTATADLVSADGSVQNTTGDPGTFGPTSAHSLVAVVGLRATAGASSKAQDVALAAGVVKIGSVVSSAAATTDGITADGTGLTTVSGMSIAGQPVTVDEKGFHVGSASQPANAIANQIVQQAVSKGGIVIVLSAPTKEVDGPKAVINAGSLIVSWTTSGSIVTTILGGAEASVTGAQGEVDDGGTVVPVVPVSTVPTIVDNTPVVTSPGTADQGSGATTDHGSLTGVTARGSSPTTVARRTQGSSGPSGATGLSPVLAADVGHIPNYTFLAVVAILLLSVGLRRLCEGVLHGGRKTAVDCPLTEDR